MSTKRYVAAYYENGEIIDKAILHKQSDPELVLGWFGDKTIVLEADLAEMTVCGATDHERYEFHERRMLYHCAEEARLRPVTRGEPVMPESMCDVSQLKRTYEAAKEWKRWIDDGTGKMPDVGNALYGALVALFPDLAAQRKERVG